MRTYYYAVLGAMGGLLGWQISNLLGLSFTGNLYVNEAIVGALIGVCVGFLIGAGEGLITLTPGRILRTGVPAAALGLAAGALGLPLGEILFQVLGAGLLGRALGWGVFGALIGLAEGISGGSQAWKGALGGAVGGVLGGVLLEVARQRFDQALFGKAAGMVLLGASVGALIALIVVLLSRAWLEVTSGKLKGAEFILDKFGKRNGPSAIVGSDALKADIVLPDPGIAPQHALLSGDGVRFIIRDMSPSGTYLNTRRVERAELYDRSVLRLGNTEMVYHEKR
jgi:hypothetical protein